MIEEIIKAFSLIFVAEMGDKTQILAMTCAARYRPIQVLAGIFIGIVLNHGLAILIGTYISNIVSLDILQVAAGALFILFGIFAFKQDSEDECSKKSSSKFGPVLTVAGAFFVGELGDKTQLTAMTLAMEASHPIGILIGTVAGMLVVGSIGIVIGSALTKKIPPYIIKIVSGVIFIAFGVTKLFSAASIFVGNYIAQGVLIAVVGLISLYMISKLIKSK